MASKGISLVFPVMNRTEILLQTVPTWLKSSQFDELIIVDWSSKPPVIEDSKVQSSVLSDSRVKIIRVQNEDFFLTPSYALNLGITKAANDNILKLDIDYQLVTDEFFDHLHKLINYLDRYFFIADANYCDISLTGLVFFYRSYFLQLNGYNESFRGWGFEDLDLYDRMSTIIQKTMIKNIEKFVYHLPHNNQLRQINHPDPELSTKDSEKINRARSLVFPQKQMSRYKTISSTSWYEVLERIQNA